MKIQPVFLRYRPVKFRLFVDMGDSCQNLNSHIS